MKVAKYDQKCLNIYAFRYICVKSGQFSDNQRNYWLAGSPGLMANVMFDLLFIVIKVADRIIDLG